jgi:hypothetical protein
MSKKSPMGPLELDLARRRGELTLAEMDEARAESIINEEVKARKALGSTWTDAAKLKTYIKAAKARIDVEEKLGNGGAVRIVQGTLAKAEKALKKAQ